MILDWLLTSIDLSRVHDVGIGVSWHARIMIVAWGILSPSAVIIARFFKIMPNQNWPKELDWRFWWKYHWMVNLMVIILSLVGLVVILNTKSTTGMLSLHKITGYTIICFSVLQGLSGLFRGSKGGPTARAKDGSLNGDHYNMTKWRLMFEMFHKTIGYSTLILIVICILEGLWLANAPKWMWIIIIVWWVMLIIMFIHLQRKGRAIETYQAIWGPDKVHPGNRKPPTGWYVQRPSDNKDSQS